MNVSLSVRRTGLDLPRVILQVDGLVVAASGVLAAIGARPQVQFLGLGAPMALVGLGVGVLLCAARLLRDSRRHAIARSMVAVPALLNDAW